MVVVMTKKKGMERKMREGKGDRIIRK